MSLPHKLSLDGVLDLATIADSGQIFRMFPRGDQWTVVQGNTVVLLEHVGGHVWYDTWPGGQTELVERLFRADIAVSELHRELSVDFFVAEAARAWPGLWLLQQDPWETLVSFIISANKHFRHIQQCCQTLAERFGDELRTPWGIFYAFPSPERLALVLEEELRSCKVGYRASFIMDAARVVSTEADFLQSVANAPYEDAAGLLTSIKGIGDKVADCILLFAYARDGVVPYDVWLRRICVDLYDQRSQAPYKELRAWHSEHFGPLAGWAQQWLFCHARAVHRRGISLKETWFLPE